MIQARNLRKSFDRRLAVNDVSFEAPDGTITGVLGSNGAGKSTTLRMICGALQPDSGTVQMDGVAASADPVIRQQRLGALLDHTGIYGRLTTRENLTYFGRLRGMDPAYLRERVECVLSTLGLEQIANRRTAGFSQGERMKTALGRALLHSPQNLILDEPTNGLDVPTVRSLRDLLKRLRDSGRCILYSSHILDEVRALCDRVIVISAGRLITQGTVDEICAQAESSSFEEAFLKLTCDREKV